MMIYGNLVPQASQGLRIRWRSAAIGLALGIVARDNQDETQRQTG